MAKRKGFSLIEIIVVTIVVGGLAAIMVTGYNTVIQQQSATAANNNLTAIYNAQKTYYLNNGSYCLNSCNSLTNINSNLSLNITDSYNSYACSALITGTGFNCTATSNATSNVSSTCGGTGQAMNTPVNGICGTWSACDASCTDDGTSYGQKTCTANSSAPQCGGRSAVGTMTSCSFVCACQYVGWTKTCSPS